MATHLALFDDSSTTWRIEPSALTPALQEIWADAIIDPTNWHEARDFTWRFQTSSGPAETYLHADGTCLYIDAALADAAEIACLFRQYVPESIEVIFCDQSYNFDLVITSDTTPAELITKVHALDDAPRQPAPVRGLRSGGRRSPTTGVSSRPGRGYGALERE